MNYDLFKAINNLSGNSAVDDAMKFAAKDVIFLMIAILVAVCLVRCRRRSIRPVVLTAVALILTFALGLLAAAVHPEKRPFQTHRVHQLIAHAGGQSFPSDHATAGFGIALAVLVFLSWRWGLILFALAVLIGFARVYDGIHYPGDIGGSLLAAAVGVAAITVATRMLSPDPSGAETARPSGSAGEPDG